MTDYQQLSNAEYVKLLTACLFQDGEGKHFTDTDKAQIVGMMGQAIPEGGAGFGTTGERYFIPKNVVLHPEFPGPLDAWYKAVESELFEERSTGYLVPAGLINLAERSTGKNLAEAHAIYQQTRPSGSDKTR